jgi:hypothetical protein
MPRKNNEPAPPGPILLDVRVNGRLQFSQRVHTHPVFDETDDRVTITASKRPPAAEKRADEQPE